MKEKLSTNILTSPLQGHFREFQRKPCCESPLRIRSPSREEHSLEYRRNSRKPPRHHSTQFPSDPASRSEKDKGKGKLVIEVADQIEDVEEDSPADYNTIPANFEFGSGSGAGREEEAADHPPPPKTQSALASTGVKEDVPLM